MHHLPPVDRSDTCPDCGGKGDIVDHDRTTGKVILRLPCARCDGEGKIYTKEEFDEAVRRRISEIAADLAWRRFTGPKGI